MAPKKYGAAAQEPIKTDGSKPVGPEVINRVHKIFRSLLYYAISVDPTIIVSLSTLAIKQAKVTTQTIKNLHQLIDYLVTHPYANIRYYASNMIINVQSDVSCLSATNSKIRAAGHFFLGWKPQDKHPIHLNGAIFTLCHILNFVAASSAEAELGALFLKAK